MKKALKFSFEVIGIFLLYLIAVPFVFMSVFLSYLELIGAEPPRSLPIVAFIYGGIFVLALTAYRGCRSRWLKLLSVPVMLAAGLLFCRKYSCTCAPLNFPLAPGAFLR
jgi:hypothetical protein